MPGQSHAYEVLKRFLQISTASLPADLRLEQILQSISEAFQSTQCLLLKPDQIDRNGLFSPVVLEKKALWVEDGASFGKERILPDERRFLFPAFGCLPLSDGDSFQGILYLSFSKPRNFSSEEIDLLLLVAKGIGEILRNAALHSEAEQTISELTALHALGRSVASTLNLDDLFELIIRSGLKILKAKGGVLRFEDKKTRELKVRFNTGSYDQYPLDEKMAKKVFDSQVPFSLDPFDQEKPFLSVLCAPLLSKGRSLGTLAFYDKEAADSKFNDQDFQLLLTMANQISCSIENAMIHDETFRLVLEHEKSMGQLSTLYELNKTLLTTVHLKRILQMTLTAITIGEGLRFNRAMLFIVDEKTRTLKGTMAIGPNNAEEAGRIWKALSEKKGSPSEVITHLEPPPESASQLNLLVRGIEIPLEQNQCILARTVLEERPFNTRVSQSKQEKLQTGCKGGCCLHSKIGCDEGQLLSRDPMSYAFATAPLRGKGRVIGVILVDNLFNQNPIEDEDIQFLSMFANQAGLAIENALLYRNLEEVHQELQKAQALIVHQEKMAALGELSNTIAHEIKNPLTTIGGFARRLHRTIPAESPQKRYTQTIIQEVDRLENVLNHFNHYTHEDSITFDSQDLPRILEESLSSIPEISTGKIQLFKEYAEGVPRVSGDPQQLKQAFYNLIKNACESMDQKGTLLIRIYPFSKNGASYARVEIKDTGKGITPEDLTNIFNPFYSTKESSLGLGLPIVHKIVTSHRGQIEVDNRLGEGVTFIITFPAFERRERRPNGI
jgi:two-component system, NtrC family, sensor histidine kinase HydH